jgi:hypothetical protein
MPEMGKHKFLYPLGKDQKERDRMTSFIVKPVFSYPTPENPGGELTANMPRKKRIAKDDLKQNHVKQDNSQSQTMKDILNRRVRNPITGNSILVKTALGYEKDHPSYRQAVGMVSALSKKFGIKLKQSF